MSVVEKAVRWMRWERLGSEGLMSGILCVEGCWFRGIVCLEMKKNFSPEFNFFMLLFRRNVMGWAFFISWTHNGINSVVYEKMNIEFTLPKKMINSGEYHWEMLLLLLEESWNCSLTKEISKWKWNHLEQRNVFLLLIHRKCRLKQRPNWTTIMFPGQPSIGMSQTYTLIYLFYTGASQIMASLNLGVLSIQM